MSIEFECKECGQRLKVEDSESNDLRVCPKCDARILVPNESQPFKRKKLFPKTKLTEPQISGLAVSSMVIGALALAAGVVLTGIYAPLAAIILGHIAMFLIWRHRPFLKGMGFAVAGVTFGYISLILWIVLAVQMKEVEREIDGRIRTQKEITQSIGNEMNRMIHQMDKINKKF